MTFDPSLFWLIVGLALLSGFLVGWDRAVHRHRDTQARLITAAHDLEEQLATFHQAAQRDPQRTWIDIGKNNVVNQMEGTLRTIRTTLEKRS